MAGRIVLAVSLFCWLLVDVAICQEKLEAEDFQKLCQEERELKSKYDDASQEDKSTLFSDYLEVYRRRMVLGKEVRQQFCPLELVSMPPSAKPSEFSTPLTWSLEMTERFGDLDLFNEICWHELFTRRELASSPYKLYKMFEQEYALVKEKKNVLGKKLNKDCTSILEHWPGRSEFPGNHRTNQDYIDHKCSEESKSQFICERLHSASFSTEIERQVSELSQMWCQRYQFIKWIRSSLCNDEQGGKCCGPERVEKGKNGAIKVLAETIATEAETAIKAGVRHLTRGWFDLITTLENYAQPPKGTISTKEQQKLVDQVKKAKERVAKALGI